MTTYRVDITERELGWGQRNEGREYFSGKDALVKAKAFQKKYNDAERASNISGITPDTYWLAEDPILVPDEEAPKKKRSKSK
jgi:hypothetical protein